MPKVKVEQSPAPVVPTYAFEFYQSPENPKEFTSKYLRDGEAVFEITAPNSFIYNVAVMERKMRLAPFQS